MMFKLVKIVAALGLLALLLAACGSAETTSELPLDAGGGNGGADACLVGEPECQDTFPDSGEPTGPPPPGLPISSVANTPIDGGFVISGFYFDDGEDPLLCEALAESYPPQCGGASIAFDNTAGAELGVLSIEQGVTWSDQPVLIEGEVVDGVFVARG
jgi:hypothetical protein